MLWTALPLIMKYAYEVIRTHKRTIALSPAMLMNEARGEVSIRVRIGEFYRKNAEAKSKKQKEEKREEREREREMSLTHSAN
jgi:hypothetical protein